MAFISFSLNQKRVEKKVEKSVYDNISHEVDKVDEVAHEIEKMPKKYYEYYKRKYMVKDE